MPSRAHLTPARITDKRGRNTTVYRKEAGPAEKASVPAPAAPALPDALREPKPLTTAELLALVADVMSLSSRPLHEVRAMLATEEAGRTAAALAAEALKTGVLNWGERHALLHYAVSRAREGFDAKACAALALNLLRVATRVRHRSPHWTTDLIDATRGASHGSVIALVAPLETEAQLDSLVAVVEFTMENADTGAITDTPSNLDIGKGRSIKNRELEGLLRERPHDLDRVLTYTQGRDMRSADSVANLRQWLDATEHNPAVGDGWL